MDKDRIISEFLKGATIDGLSKQYLAEEKERIKMGRKSAKGRPTVTYAQCRNKIEDTILREVWHKIYSREN